MFLKIVRLSRESGAISPRRHFLCNRRRRASSIVAADHPKTIAHRIITHT
jgi:hypothetical protein